MLETGIGRAHNIHLASLPNFSLPGDIAASKRYYEPDLIEPADRGRRRRNDRRARRPRHRRDHRAPIASSARPSARSSLDSLDADDRMMRQPVFGCAVRLSALAAARRAAPRRRCAPPDVRPRQQRDLRTRRWRGSSGSRRIASSSCRRRPRRHRRRCRHRPRPHAPVVVPAPPPTARPDRAAEGRRSAHPAPRRAGGRTDARGRRAWRRWRRCWPATAIPKCGRWPRSRSGCSATGQRRRRAGRGARAIPSRSCRAAPPRASGLIGHKPAAESDRRDDGSRTSRPARSPGIPPDDLEYPKAPPVEAVRLGMYALVRLGGVSTARVGAHSTARRSRSAAGGRSPTPSAGSAIPGPAPVLLSAAAGRGRHHARVRGARPGRGQGGAGGRAARRRRSANDREVDERADRSGARAGRACGAVRRADALDEDPDDAEASSRTCVSRRSPRWGSSARRAAPICCRSRDGAAGRRCAPRR